MKTSSTFYFNRGHNTYVFRRMTRTEWYETAHLLRRFHITDGMLQGLENPCEEQFLMHYSGIEGFGVTISPLFSTGSTYITNCRRLYQFAETAEERQEQLENAREWYNKYVKAR